MFRLYFTVIKDSFHEAFASRVLWIVLAATTILLLALAPLGLQEQRSLELRISSVSDWPALIARIRQQSQAQEPSPGKHVWELAGEEFQNTIKKATKEKGEPQVSRDIVYPLLKTFNELLLRPDFYSEPAWAEIRLPRDVAELIDRGAKNLPQRELGFLNRELLRAAFPREISGTPEEELHFSYLGMAVGGPLPVGKNLARPVIDQMLAGVMNFFVGTIAVFVAILVTASMIPNTFEAGAIDLLLSKPVNRSLLFLVKFAGGCAFILLCGSYFVAGLWLIMGLRFEVWNNALLLCIPIFMFLFLIYYSVSALAAVIWRNAVVSIVIAILFWTACFVVGTAKVVIEQLFIDPIRITQLLPAGDTLVAVNQTGEFKEFRAGQWENIFAGGGNPNRSFGRGEMLLGPVYDAPSKSMIYIEKPFRRGRFDFGRQGDPRYDLPIGKRGSERTVGAGS